MTDSLLTVEGLGRRFGGLIAVDDLSLEVRAGSILGVIGPNGAGKSTLIGLIAGALRVSTGSVRLEGRDITARSAAARARLGIGRTYQIPRPFLEMTVEENLEVAQLGSGRRQRVSVARVARSEILERCGLTAERDRFARELPLLRRKRLEVARALALEPRLLLLDEVGAGLTGEEITELVNLIRSVQADGVTVLLVEHVLRIVRETCTRLIVLNFGRKLAEGRPAEVLSSDAVAEVYLGTAHSSSAAVPAAATGSPMRCALSRLCRRAGGHCFAFARSMRATGRFVRSEASRSRSRPVKPLRSSGRMGRERPLWRMSLPAFWRRAPDILRSMESM